MWSGKQSKFYYAINTGRRIDCIMDPFSMAFCGMGNYLRYTVWSPNNIR